MARKKQYQTTNIGSVTLLMVFIVLCMVTFAVLSLSEAVRDNQYSLKMAAHNKEYYQASNLAQEKIFEIDDILHTIERSHPSKKDYLSKAYTELKKDSSLTIDNSKKALKVSWKNDMNNKQAIEVVLTISDDKHYTITEYKEISLQEWKGDTSLNLINPDEKIKK